MRVLKLNLILSLLLILSCSDEKDLRPEIPDEYYNVKVTILDDAVDSVYADFIYEYPMSYKYSTTIFDIENLYDEKKYGWHSIYYSSLEKHHNFKNHEFEIKSYMGKYVSYDNTSNRVHFPFDFIVGIKDSKNDKDCLSAFYIIWIRNQKEDINQKDNVLLGINTADTIYTNLQTTIINKFFPEFSGIIVDGNVSNIEIDYNRVKISYRTFLSAIYFNGFDSLFPVVNYKFAESIINESMLEVKEAKKQLMKGVYKEW